MQTIKCVVVGDGAVGKTSILMCYATDTFPEQYIPTIFDNYKTDLQIGDKFIQLCLWDTAGQDDYDRIRPLSYPESDVILLCFSIDNLSSFQNIETKWCPEISYYCPYAPLLLVGTKIDLREDRVTKTNSRSDLGDYISYNQAAALAHKINAFKYVECSAKTQKGVKAVFDEAARVVLFPKKPKKKQRLRCNLI